MPSTTTARIDRLRSVPIFSELTQKSLREISKLLNDFEAPAGHVLIQPRTPGAGLFVISEGTAAVERGKHRIELGPGEFFGELALLDEQILRTARVRAVTDLRGLVLNRDDFGRLLGAEPKMALSMLRILARRLAASLDG